MKTCFTWRYFLGFSCQSCDCFMIHLKKWREIHKNRDTAWHCVLFCQLCLDSAEAIWMEVVLFRVPAWQSWTPQTLSLDLQLGIQASHVAQAVKYLLAMLETWVQSLGLEDPLKKEMATRCSILIWRISWTEESSGLQSMGVTKSQTQLSAGSLDGLHV